MASRVSAIVPVWNRPDHLRGAIESLIATRYPNLEILIIDDGSSDDTLARAQELEVRFPHVIRVLQHDDGRNHGPGASRNLGVRKSTGTYVCFLDSDDVVLSNRFDVAVPLLDRNATIDGVAEPYHVQGRKEAPPLEPTTRSPLAKMMVGLGIQWNTNTILLRRQCVLQMGGFSETLRTCEDLVLWIKLILAARIADGGPQAVAMYRLHEQNTGLVLENSLRAHLEVMRWTRGRALDQEKITAMRETTWGKMLFVCDRLIREGRAQRAIRMLGASATASPSFLVRAGFWKNLLRAALTRVAVLLPGAAGR